MVAIYVLVNDASDLIEETSIGYEEKLVEGIKVALYSVVYDVKIDEA